MQASRLLSILLRLQTQGRVSAAVLARAHEVSVRTIYRDVDALSAAGVPIYAEKGRQGGFALRQGYRTQLTGLDRPEAESLFLAGVPHAAAQMGLGPALQTTRLKLLASLSAEARLAAERVVRCFYLDPTAWFAGTDDQRLLPELAAAVWGGRMLNIRYDSWKGVVQRRLAPLGLVQKGGLWYLVAAADGQPRSYRVAYIESLAIEPEPASSVAAAGTAATAAAAGTALLPGFDLQAYWTHFAADFEARMHAAQAQVRARPAALRPLARMSHAMAQAVAAAPPSDALGWHHLTIPIESIEVAVGELLRLGPEVQAQGPPELLAALRRALQALNGVYADRAQPQADKARRAQSARQTRPAW